MNQRPGYGRSQFRGDRMIAQRPTAVLDRHTHRLEGLVGRPRPLDPAQQPRPGSGGRAATRARRPGSSWSFDNRPDARFARLERRLAAV